MQRSETEGRELQLLCETWMPYLTPSIPIAIPLPARDLSPIVFVPSKFPVPSLAAWPSIGPLEVRAPMALQG